MHVFRRAFRRFRRLFQLGAPAVSLAPSREPPHRRLRTSPPSHRTSTSMRRARLPKRRRTAARDAGGIDSATEESAAGVLHTVARHRRHRRARPVRAPNQTHGAVVVAPGIDRRFASRGERRFVFRLTRFGGSYGRRRAPPRGARREDERAEDAPPRPVGVPRRTARSPDRFPARLPPSRISWYPSPRARRRLRVAPFPARVRTTRLPEEMAISAGSVDDADSHMSGATASPDSSPRRFRSTPRAETPRVTCARARRAERNDGSFAGRVSPARITASHVLNSPASHTRRENRRRDLAATRTPARTVGATGPVRRRTARRRSKTRRAASAGHGAPTGARQPAPRREPALVETREVNACFAPSPGAPRGVRDVAPEVGAR